MKDPAPHLGLVLFTTTLSTLFILVCAYSIPTLRSAVLAILDTSGTSRGTLLAQVVSASSSPNTVDDSLFSPHEPAKYEYKLLRSVTECTLNRLGAQGFQATQFGGNIDTQGNADTKCSQNKSVDVLDWVLFVRQTGGSPNN